MNNDVPKSIGNSIGKTFLFITFRYKTNYYHFVHSITLQVVPTLAISDVRHKWNE